MSKPLTNITINIKALHLMFQFLNFIEQLFEQSTILQVAFSGFGLSLWPVMSSYISRVFRGGDRSYRPQTFPIFYNYYVNPYRLIYSSHNKLRASYYRVRTFICILVLEILWVMIYEWNYWDIGMPILIFLPVAAIVAITFSLMVYWGIWGYGSLVEYFRDNPDVLALIKFIATAIIMAILVFFIYIFLSAGLRWLNFTF